MFFYGLTIVFSIIFMPIGYVIGFFAFLFKVIYILVYNSAKEGSDYLFEKFNKTLEES